MLGAMLPASEHVPGYGAADLSLFWMRYPDAAPPLLKLGLRAAVWWVSLWCFARHWASPVSVSAQQRDQLLADLSSSRFYLNRQLMLVLKLIATMALFTDSQARLAADP